MKLSHPTLEEEIVFEDGSVNLLVVENQSQLSSYVLELINGSEGSGCDFVLSEANNIIKIDGSVEVLTDPFRIDPNSRGILSELYSHLKKESNNEENYVNTNALIGSVESYIEGLINIHNSLLVTSDSMNILSLIKDCGVRFSLCGTTIENLCDYLSIKVEYSEIKLFVLINFKGFFSKEDLIHLYNHVSYQKISILMIEQCETDVIEKEKITIIDKDLCEVRKSVDKSFLYHFDD